MNILREMTTYKALESIIRYDAKDGRVYWLVDRSRTAKAGNEIGTRNKTQRTFKYHGKVYQTHRLIYWLETHTLPEMITHRATTLNERGERDNRFTNLITPVAAHSLKGTPGKESKQNSATKPADATQRNPLTVQ